MDAPQLKVRRPVPWRGGLLFVGTLALTVALAFIPTATITTLGNYGYLGVFLLTLLASATIVLPSPAIGVALLAGKALNPWLVGVCGGLGAALGETTGYLAGRGGSALAERSAVYARIARWVERYGTLTVFALSVVPGPFLDLAGIAAGTLRMPFRRFMLACIAGKVLRFIAVAWAGRYLGTSGVL